MHIVNPLTGFIQIFGSKNSRLFPDFFQENNFFFQTQGYQTGDQYRPLKKPETNPFQRCTANIQVKLNMI